MTYACRTERYGLVSRVNYEGKSWGKGAWDDEPDYVRWVTDAGLKAVIMRHTLGFLCGYVVFRGADLAVVQDLSSLDFELLDAHGGITYIGTRVPGHYADDEDEGSLVVVGFDCAHFPDFCPASELGDVSDYKGVDFVRSQCEQIAGKIAKHYPNQ